jgi:hypothetical protein
MVNLENPLFEAIIKFNCEMIFKSAFVFCVDVRMILNDVVMYNKYEDFMVRRVLATDPDTRWCPQPDCG